MISSADPYGDAWPDYAAIADVIDGFTFQAYVMNPPSIGWTTASQPLAGGGMVGGHARDYVTLVADYPSALEGTDVEGVIDDAEELLIEDIQRNLEYHKFGTPSLLRLRRLTGMPPTDCFDFIRGLEGR